MAAHLDFQTDNNFIGGICTGMSVSWSRTCLRKSRPPRNLQEMGMGHSLAAEFTQRQYLVGGNADFGALLDSRGLQSDREETKRAKWYTIKSHRFLNAAREAARDPGVYLLCTQNHTMAACNFPGGAGPLFAFFDPNFGQYHYDAVAEFPSWYWQHVSSIPNYDLSESILFKLSRV